MLTIKHINSAGLEYIQECETATWVLEPMQDYGFSEAGLYLDYGHDGHSYHIPTNRLASSLDKVSPHVFVMNKHGATIAKYML